ncbi:MAG: hypothetical protein LC792_04340 [Actinobacteria bacterium]|nr:hypothetical protein [Actinomycetota bacterium]
MPGRRLLFSLVAALVLLGGCRVDASVDMQVHEVGGTVTARFTLDPEAVAILGGAVGEGAQTSDLSQAGWKITPVKPTEGGGARVELSKDFDRPGDLGVVIGELAGPSGPLQGFGLERRRSFAAATFRLRGTADVGPGAAAVTGFGNVPDLAARLRDAGVDPGRVEDLLAGRAADGLHFRLDVALPGKTASFEVKPGAAQAIDVSSSVSDRRRPVLLTIALVTGLIVVFRLRRGRHSGALRASPGVTQS